MPPSAGACQTIDAALNPDCGRASNWSSIITAIGWRIAAAGDTSRPVSGSATSTGLGVGLGVGAVDGPAELPLGVALGVVLGVAIAPLDGGALPRPATRP